LATEGEDRVDPEAHHCFEGDAERLINPADLFDRDAQAGEVAVRPAPPYSPGAVNPNRPSPPIF